jgi:hypothetical protein
MICDNQNFEKRIIDCINQAKYFYAIHSLDKRPMLTFKCETHNFSREELKKLILAGILEELNEEEVKTWMVLEK